MIAQPVKEHEWLQQLVGEWSFEGECSSGPDQPPMKSTGKETVRSLGGLWVIGEGESEIPGTGMTGQMIFTLGYDPQKGKYVATWIGSMMANLWVYDCTMDPGGKKLIMAAEGPSFGPDGSMGTGMAQYRDVIEILTPDHRTLSSFMLGPDGQWIPFMVAHYRRK